MAKGVLRVCTRVFLPLKIQYKVFSLVVVLFLLAEVDKALLLGSYLTINPIVVWLTVSICRFLSIYFFNSVFSLFVWVWGYKIAHYT